MNDKVFYDSDAGMNLLREARSLLQCFEVDLRAGKYVGHASGCLVDLRAAVARFEKGEAITHDRIAMIKRLRERFQTSTGFMRVGLHDSIEMLDKKNWDYEAAVDGFKCQDDRK